MILFHAPFPYEREMNNGMFIRIYAIDQVFADRERTYFWEDTSVTDISPVPEYPVPHCTYYKINPFISEHRQLIYDLVNQAEFVYCQTEYYSSLIVDLLPSRKVVIDLHGCAPEECRMEGQPDQAELCDFFEKKLVQESRCLIAVTEALLAHLHKKHGDFAADTLILPIMNNMPANIAKAKRSKLKCIYAGDIAAWQNVDLMLKSIALMDSSRYEFIIYTRKQEEMRELCNKYNVLDKVKIDSFTVEQKSQILSEADFGFVLRDDDPVNKVACPTKLMEYLQFGVIPIVLFEDIGDFLTAGYRYFTLSQFSAGNYDIDQLVSMRETNLRVYQKFYQRFADNTEKLKQLTLRADNCFFRSGYDVNIGMPFQIVCRFRYHGRDQDMAEERRVMLVSYRNEFDVFPAKPNFSSVEIYPLFAPVLFKQFTVAPIFTAGGCRGSKKPCCLQEDRNGYSFYDKTVALSWSFDASAVSGIHVRLFISAIGHELAYYKEGDESLLHGNMNLRKKIDAVKRYVQLKKESKSARLLKICHILLHPERVGEKNFLAILYKKFFKKKPIGVNYNIYSEIEDILADPVLPAGSQFSKYQTSDFCGDVCIFASVPYDDIGGGQRSAQLTRCLLSRMFHVTYIYKYPKVENGRQVSNEFSSSQISHIFFDNAQKDEISKNITPQTTVIFELPHPEFLPWLKLANETGAKTVYELIDPWEISLGEGWYDAQVEETFIHAAFKVSATSKVLYQKLISAGRSDAVYSPNAADERFFPIYSELPRPADFPQKYKKNIVYFGSMYGCWFNWEFLKEAAIRNSDTGFLMIGDPPVKHLPLPDNVLFLGIRENDELATYLRVANAAIIPFIPSKLVDAVSPVKAFEYIFTGTPVITTRMPEISEYPGVYQAETAKEFASLCELKEIAAAPLSQRELFLSKNSWASRCDQIVEQSPLKSTYSIIILIHNNKRVIERCLTTLLYHLAGLDKVEVIVVDNASEDGGGAFVEEIFGKQVMLLKNPINGCSAGRNLGASKASNEILVFFDSDQWFTSIGWLYEYDFIHSLHPEIGAMAWNAGWFSSDDLHGPIVDSVAERGTDVLQYQKYGFRTDIHYLATSGFFIKKSLFVEIGGLDEQYDPTIFEDTDLSMKILHHGEKIAYRNFSGIMHQAHQTTRANAGGSEYAKLWKRNRQIFMGKWGAYIQKCLSAKEGL